MIVIDGWGSTGLILDYAIIILFSGAAFLIFFYLWKKNRLNFDEEPKHLMLEDDQHGR